MDVQWELLFFSLFLGLGMGCFAFVSVSEWMGKLQNIRLPGAITSLVFLAIGGFIAAFHLGHPERAFHVLGNVKSGISQEFILSAIAGAFIVLYIALLLWQGASDKARKNVAIIGLIPAVLLVFSSGYIYVLGARPAWNTFILPLMYLAMAAPLGLFTMYLWLVKKEADKKTLQRVSQIAFYSLLVFALLLVAYIVYLFLAPFPDPSRSALRLLSGDLFLIFWGLVVLLGLIVPLIISYRNKKGSSEPASISMPVIALASFIVGSVGLRAIIYLLGTSVHRFIVG